MIKFYYNSAPNPMKVALLLEELGLAYEPCPIDTRKGDQHQADYVALNPNAKAPTIVDDGTVVFDSNAILLYLAEKERRFLPTAAAERGQMLSWLMFIASGIGPYSGQAVHFRHFAPESAYAINRYTFEVERHYKILDERLTSRAYMMGDEYTIIDMALWGWARLLPRVLGDDSLDTFPNVKRLVDELTVRPAGQRAVELANKHAFKTEMDAAALHNMFPQNERLANDNS